MNNRHQIKISDVKISPRQRKEMGDVALLAESIREHGLIQPIVLDPQNVLIAGERRIRAHQHLGLDVIDFCYKDEVEEDVKAELEFEENFHRKAFTWQEECLGILDIFRKKRLKGMREGWTWGQRQCGEMFGMSLGSINYVLKVSVKLESELSLPAEKRRYWKFNSVAEAYRLGLMAEEEDAANALLALRAKASANTQTQNTQARVVVEEVERITATPDALALARERYQSNPHNIIPFDTYLAEKQAAADGIKNTVYLSNKFTHGDSILWMNSNPSRVDHIITDPPYAIDMDHLNQQNQHGGMVDLDRVRDAHQIDENTLLLERFFPAAFNCTKENAFVVVFGDPMLWNHMHHHATLAGFAVQRWPIIWRKVNQSVMNNCAGYNSTKDYEIIMVCRKPGATLAKKLNTSFIEGSNMEATKLTGHPFAKPFEVVRTLIEITSFENQTILDPFAGGGSLVLEFLRQKRNFHAIEKEEHHFNSLIENVKREYYLKLNSRFVFK